MTRFIFLRSLTMTLTALHLSLKAPLPQYSNVPLLVSFVCPRDVLLMADVFSGPAGTSRTRVSFRKIEIEVNFACLFLLDART